MSSIYTGTSSRHSGGGSSFSDNTIVKFWNDYVKVCFFGILYAMVKENTFGIGFTVAGFVFEFIQMIILCFRNAFHWGGIDFDYNFNNNVIGYSAWSIIFWIIVALVGATLLTTTYMGYSFYKGEIKSIYLLKLLRVAVALFITILYIPVLYFIFSGLACNYSTNPPSLLLYPSHACWGNRTFITIIAIVLSFAFLFCSFFCGSVFYEFDPTETRGGGKLQNRFEFIALVVKFVLVAVTVFLMNHPQAFVALSFFSSLFLFAASVFILPFYSYRLNLTRSGSFGGILWVNLWMVISYILEDKNSLVTIISAFCGIPVAIAAGAFAADRRFKYLCNSTLVDGYISSAEEMDTMPVHNQKKKKVNWEKPKSNKLMKNRLFVRLLFPWDVEIAARFVLSGKPNAATIEKAKAVYQTGLSKFPNSPTVLQGYANFLFTTVGDWQLGYAVLEKLRKMSPYTDIQFFIYRYDRDRERRTEGGGDKIGDFVDFMEYKKLMQESRRYHMTSLVCVRKFWHYLLEPKVDVMKLSVLSNKIATAEKRATEQYTKLLTNHPKNIRVLRDYARFLEEVVLDERAAHEVRRKADKYEIMEMELLTASHRSSNSHVEPIQVDSKSDDSKSHDRSDLDSMDDTTISSKSSGVRAQMISAKLDKNNSLKKLGYIMLATTALAMTVGFVELGILNTQMDNYQYSVDTQNSAAGAAQVAARIARGLSDAYSLGLHTATTGETISTLWGGTFSSIQNNTREVTIVCGNSLRSLYYGTSDPRSFTSRRARTLATNDGVKLKQQVNTHLMSYDEFDHKLRNKIKIRKFFNAPSYEERIYVEGDTSGDGYSNSRQIHKVDLWSLSSIFISFAMKLSEVTVSDYNDMVTYGQKNIVASGYVYENTASLAAGMRDLIVLYSDDISHSLKQLLLTIMIMFTVAGVLLLLGAIAVFRPTVQRIFASKVRTFTMFTLIPASVVKTMSKKRIISMNVDSEEEGEEEDTHQEEEEPEAPQLRRNSNAFPKWKGKDMAPQEEINEENLREGAVLHTPRPAPLVADNRNLLAVSSSSSVSGAPLITVSSNVSDYFDRSNYNNNNNNNNNNNSSSSSNKNSNNNSNNNSGNNSLQSSTNKSDKSRSMASSIDLTTKSPADVTVEVTDDNENNHNKHNETNEAVLPSPMASLKRKLSGVALSLSALTKKNNYKKIVEEESEEKKKEKRNHSRLDVSSLQAVTRRLHFSYAIGLLCIFVALLVSYLVMKSLLEALVDISTDLKDGGFRTQYAQLVAMDVALYTIYSRDNEQSNFIISNFERDYESLLNVYTEMMPKNYQMDLLYSSSCLSVNANSCPQPGDPYYDKTSNGLEYLYFHYIMLAKKLHNAYVSNITIDISDPDYVQFRYLAETTIDGFERLLYMVSKDSKNKIDSANTNVAIITGIECIAFVLVYLILFRPFVKRLREETNHTFALIRMIPRKLLQDVPEIQEFIQETLEDD